MQIGVLISNHGKHSNEKLAIAVATGIVNIGATASGQQALDARKLENKIAEIMEGYFAKLAAFEHGEIAAKGTAHLSAALTPHPEIYEEAVHAVVVAITESPFASWFTSDRIESYVRETVGKWLHAGHHMHRDWFARHGKVGHGAELKASDKHNPDCEHVKAWIARSEGA